MVSLPLFVIKRHVNTFVRYAKDNPDLLFLVTAVGCGLAGYQNKEIAPLFSKAPVNCILPEQWKPYLQCPETTPCENPKCPIRNTRSTDCSLRVERQWHFESEKEVS